MFPIPIPFPVPIPFPFPVPVPQRISVIDARKGSSSPNDLYAFIISAFTRLPQVLLDVTSAKTITKMDISVTFTWQTNTHPPIKGLTCCLFTPVKRHLTELFKKWYVEEFERIGNTIIFGWVFGFEIACMPWAFSTGESFIKVSEVNESELQATLEAEFFTEYGEASRYQIQEVIGKGSYGVVGSAVDTHTGERVAIKKINDVFEHVSDATRILREIKLLRLLSHPDIVKIKHIMLPHSRREFKDIYVVFELMESDLHQVIKANDDLTAEHYQFFLYQLLRGLMYIHTANVFHRDLKPKNILANADCKLKICDFGLARVSFDDAPTAIFWTDYVATRWYRAPELCGSFFSKYGSHQRKILAEDLNKKWMQVLLQTSPTTPLEQCEWLNKLLIEIWPNYISPRLSLKFSSIVERRMKHRKPKLIEKIELQEFSVGSKPPLLGLNGIRWSTSSDQRILHMGFDWDTTDISIMLFAKLGKPLMGTARIVINSLHIKGDLRLMPVLDGRAFLYSFVAPPEVRIGVAFGSGGSQSLPATELPGVSAWLVKLVTDSLAKRMVEPYRNCFALPAVNLFKKAVAGVLSVTVISASRLSRSNLRGSPSRKQQSSLTDGYVEDCNDYKDLRTFVEVELEELTRRTDVGPGSCPRWDSKFNMTLHEDAGIIKFNLFECTPGSVKYDYLTSCEVKMRYVADDSTIFWATGADSTAIASRAELCGKEIEMTVPFEGINSGELTVKLVLKEWQFSDGSHSANSLPLGSQHSLSGTSSYLPRTGRKIYVTIVEGKNLPSKDKYGKSGSGCYVKFQYGKTLKRTRSVPHNSDPAWNQKFEFDELGDGEYLKIKCFTEEMFGDENIGSARVNLEGLIEGSTRDVWIPLEKVNSGELRLQIEAARVDDYEGSKGSHGSSSNGWVELAIIEAKDLVAADIRGTSDPYVRVQYGSLKKKTKVINKTLNPKWHQTLEFPDDGSPLELHVKDHNAVLPTSSIGDCVVEYQRLPLNQMFDKWIPLQGVKRGEIHIQVARKVPNLEKRSSVDSESSVTKARHQISNQMKQMMIKFQSLIEDGDLEGVAASLHEMESLHETQEEFMVQLETEQVLLLNKINELGQEIINSSPNFVLDRRPTLA